MQNLRPVVSRELLQQLAALRPTLESQQRWPATQLQLLQTNDLLGWTIPQRFGGSARSETEVLTSVVELGRACVTTTFILTQFHAAIHRLVAAQAAELPARYLPALATGRTWATVGLSHLTTSRARGPGPAVTATPRSDGSYTLDGEIPWVTGAAHSALLVIGGTLPSGDQILVALDRDLPGVEIVDPFPLLALTASSTGPVRLVNVVVPRDAVIAGPAPAVMRTGTTGGTGSLATSALALGAGLHALDHLFELAKAEPNLSPIVTAFTDRGETLLGQLLAAAQSDATAPTPEELRYRANSFAVDTAECWLSAAKGTGFVRGHPAEQAVREAMFFHVWSCPSTVVQRHWRQLADGRRTEADY